MPGDAVRLRENATDEPRRARIDVAVRANEPLRDRADTFDDVRSPRLARLR
jgi:hypothetical protein